MSGATGKSLRFTRIRVKLLFAKYSSSVFRNYVIYIPASRAHKEGRFAIVTSAGAGCDGRIGIN
jgi:hypothetical protein